MAQFPQNAEEIGMITSYMSPVALWVSQISPYFGTSIYSSPGGLIDEYCIILVVLIQYWNLPY